MRCRMREPIILCMKSKAEFPPVPTSSRFARYWRKKTAVLEREMAALEKGPVGAAAGSGEGENERN